MKFLKYFGFVLFCWCISSSAFATQISGTTTNGTSSKPSSGDEVVLLSLAGGMDEVGHTKTDAQGRFTINVPDEGVQHLVRVVHQGVNYYRAAPPGTTTLEISVYDAAAQVANIIQESRIIRVQTKEGHLEVSEAYTLRNESQPPRTKNGDHTFEVVVPESAQVQDGMVAGPGGMPTTSVPAATGKKNRYAFSYAIKPGRSQFQVTYKLPYSGSYNFTITPETALAELGVLLPKSMKFTGAGGKFAPDTEEQGMAVFFARSLTAGQAISFSVAGEGTAPPREAPGMPAGQTSAPGGGLGAPIDAAPPLSSSRGIIIGIFIVAMAGGAFWLVRKSSAARAQANPAESTTTYTESHTIMPQDPRPPSLPANYPGGIIDVLKEELFQLENDRLQEKISQPEYEASKAGLDALLRRHMKQTRPA